LPFAPPPPPADETFEEEFDVSAKIEAAPFAPLAFESPAAG
jgi:hypothetical protein